MSSSATLPVGKIAFAASHLSSPVEVDNPLKRADWDAQVSKLPRCGIFHTAAWAAVLRDTYGFTPFYFIANRDGQLEAALPIMEVNSWLTGRRGVSLPFTDRCEPLNSSTVPQHELAERILAHGRSRQWKHLEYRGGAAIPGLFEAAAQPSLSFFGHRLGLVPDTDSLFSKFDSSVRRAIRKAEKAGVVIEISQSVAAVRCYYELHCKTRKKHGLPPQPFSFFLNIHRFILSQDMGMVVSARFNEQVVASAIFFHFGTDAIYKFGASDSAFQDLRANNLVMWEAIKWLARAGKKTLDFGRTSLCNDGLRRYKLGWGAEEFPVNYYKFDLRENLFVTDRDEVYGWHNRVFRTFPGWLARLAGTALYKHIA